LTSFARKTGLVAAGCVVIAAGVFALRGPLASGTLLQVPPSVVAQPVGDLPDLPDKPTPSSYALDGCPPEGKGGDPQLNFLKNRADAGNYMPVSFDSLMALTWPKNLERQPMDQWPDSGRMFIQQYAGTPISVEGYIATIREGTPDPADCSWTSSSYLDWHLAFTQNPRDDRAQSILAEVTPRVRLQREWTMDSIHALLIDNHMRVRLSGWLYFDPEHPGDVGVTRATLWEINPVMQIQVLDKNRWVPLEGMTK
jgi:hypothetical protein